MKKLISLILFLATATVSFAQYPLPETQVHGNLYVNDSLSVGTTTPELPFHVVGKGKIVDADADGNEMFISLDAGDSTLNGYMVFVGDDGRMTGILLDGAGLQQLYQNDGGDVSHGQTGFEGTKFGASGSTWWGKMWLEFDTAAVLKCELLSDNTQYAEFAVTPYTARTRADTTILGGLVYGDNIPKYAGNAAATATLGVGAFYIDTNDSNALKISE